jgi:UDP-3-O-[3-hydroxymyristoyl] N-acetylglucosamine deacetylase/3-hydroxyacyl-[acyl-carrier-protein] dehydratase
MTNNSEQMITKQQTLKAPLSFSGRGLHTGLNVNMRVLPADVDTGLIFRRVDLEGAPEVPALGDFVIDTSRGTTIERGAARVSTIEHIVSALWTMGVDNAIIEVDAPETPIMDGSAREYAAGIVAVGLEEQNADRKYYEVTDKIVYTIPEKGVVILLYPDDDFNVSVHVDYNSKVIGNQYATFMPEDSYQDKSEYPEAYIQSDSCSAAVFQGDSQDCAKCTSHKRTYIWYYVEDACKKGDSKCCIYTQSRYGP